MDAALEALIVTVAAPVDSDAWQASAACRGTDPDLWTPDSHQKTAAAARVLGAAYCARCPVLRECAADALAMQDRYGVRAGIALAGNPGGRQSPATGAALKRVVETGRIPGQEVA